MALYGGITLPGYPDLENVRRLDLLAVPAIRRLQRYGFAIDREYCWDLSSKFSAEMRELERDISSYIPPDRLHEFSNRVLDGENGAGGDDGDNDQVAINVASADQIRTLLFDVLGIGAEKQLKKTKTGDKISTGKAQLRDLELEHPVVPLILAHRERAKLIGTYSDALPRIARFHPRGSCCPVCELPHSADTWRVHTEIVQTRAVTGRMASRNPNCFSGDTEVLTRGGWVRFDELLADHTEVMQWSEDRHLEWVMPNAYIYRGSAKFVHITNQHTDLLVTEDHRCLLWSEYGDVWLANQYPRSNETFQPYIADESTWLIESERTSSATISVVPGTAPAYCVSVPSSYIVVRRNGKVVITGNCQNIPQRTELGSWVRAAFMASPGTKLVSCDFSQIELRMMAHLANCRSMLDVYAADGDIHTLTAMQCFGIDDPKKLDKISHRIPAKTAGFLCLYGGSGKALYAQLLMAMLLLISEKKLAAVPEWLTVEWCEQFVDGYFEVRPELLDYMSMQAYRAKRYGMVWDLTGRVRLTPEVRSCHSWIKAAGERQGGNMADQGTSSALMKLAMAEVNETLVQLHRDGTWCWPLLPIHDQLMIEVEEDEADELLYYVQYTMDNVTMDKDSGENLLRVPIKSDGEVIDRWLKPEVHVWNENTRQLEAVKKGEAKVEAKAGEKAAEAKGA